MRKSQKFIALGAVVTLGLFATACGSDSDDAATEEETTETVVEEYTEDTATDDTATDSTDAEAPQTIVDIAAGNPDFSTLVSLVTAADLVETHSQAKVHSPYWHQPTKHLKHWQRRWASPLTNWQQHSPATLSS